MADKLTPWFAAHIKPVRVGVYETDTRNGRYQHWNGQFWGMYDPEIDAAFGARQFQSDFQFPRWRGLANPPK